MVAAGAVPPPCFLPADSSAPGRLPGAARRRGECRARLVVSLSHMSAVAIRQRRVADDQTRLVHPALAAEQLRVVRLSRQRGATSQILNARALGDR